jgi:tRNA pseudouridine38-40 synthase
MAYYKIILAYDGTAYHGWQKQVEVSSIAGVLEKTFCTVFKQPVFVIGASRTDAGVHALGQVVLINTPLEIDPAILHKAWKNSLPSDIVIRSLSITDQMFHPQANVRQKTYYYHFFLEQPLPFVQKYGWYYRFPVDMDKLERILNLFVGTHDFRSFCSNEEWENNTIRTIDRISLEHIRYANVFRIAVSGQRFMRHMIRRIVGASIEAASRAHISEAYINNVLAEKNPEQTLPNAPAKGLVLYHIYYNER